MTRQRSVQAAGWGPYDAAVDDDYLGLVAVRNAFIVPTLGMVTRRKPYRRPVHEDPFFQEQVPDEVVAMSVSRRAAESVLSGRAPRGKSPTPAATAGSPRPPPSR